MQEYARQRTEADRAAFVDHTIRVKQHVEQVRQNAVAVRNEIQAQRKEAGRIERANDYLVRRSLRSPS